MSSTEQALLCFKISRLHFALSLGVVERTLRAVEVAKVPDANEILYGLINYHSELIPVINLRHRFGLPAKEITPHDRFVIVIEKDKKMALVVDSIDEVKIVQNVKLRTVDIPLSFSQTKNKSLINDTFSFIAEDEGILMIYDIDKLINTEAAVHIEKILKAQTAAS